MKSLCAMAPPFAGSSAEGDTPWNPEDGARAAVWLPTPTGNQTAKPDASSLTHFQQRRLILHRTVYPVGRAVQRRSRRPRLCLCTAQTDGSQSRNSAACNTGWLPLSTPSAALFASVDPQAIVLNIQITNGLDRLAEVGLKH